MTKVTFIDRNGDDYTKESAGIHVSDAGVHTKEVTFQTRLTIPKSVRTVSNSTIEGWEIVVTDDGETDSGVITNAGQLVFQFHTMMGQHQQPTPIP
jgi:hypothetical protein